jgi:hypothetical protein
VSVVAAPLVALSLLSGCASTKTLTRQSSAATALPKPARVIVYDFATSPDEIEPDNPIADQYERRSTAQTPEDKRLGRMLSDQVAQQLVHELGERGIGAVRANQAGALTPNDYLIKGEFVSIVEGNRMRRMLIGFGAGSSELQSLVQIYLVTSDGVHRVSEVEVTSKGSKMPGMLVPIGVGAAAGSVVKSAAISGGLSTARELGSAPVDERAKATAEEIAKRIEAAYEKRGWK